MYEGTLTRTVRVSSDVDVRCPLPAPTATLGTFWLVGGSLFSPEATLDARIGADGGVCQLASGQNLQPTDGCGDPPQGYVSAGVDFEGGTAPDGGDTAAVLTLSWRSTGALSDPCELLDTWALTPFD